jgi:hypothetical protein
MRLALGYIEHVQDLLSMVTDRFRWNTGQIIDAEEGDDRHHDQHKQRPMRNLDLPGIACEEGLDSLPERRGAFPWEPESPNEADNGKNPKSKV